VETSLGDLVDFAPVDVATLWHSLEHMANPAEVLASLRSVLSEDGTVVLAVPNLDSLQSRVTTTSWLHLDVPRHLSHFTRRSLELLLRQEGFEPVRWWNLEIEYDLIGWSQSLMTKFSTGRPIFFDLLTQRASLPLRRVQYSNYLVGTALSALAISVLPFTTYFGAGAVLIVAARVSP
jgi:hypothetical protein